MKLLLMFLLLGSGTTSLPLPDLLSRVGKSVEIFWQQFPAVSCNELVSQSKLGNEGKVLYHQDSVFDYLVSMNYEGGDPMVDESRVLQKKAGKAQTLPLLVSNGFPTLLLIFHPYYQGSFEYARIEDDVVDGKTLLCIRFQHLQGARSTSALRLRGRDYPLELQGTAWVDPDSMAITRITASLISPMDDVGLKAMESDVRYKAFQFASVQQPYWLPVVATVDVQTQRQHWRNTHQFTNYKHFSVNSESRITK